MTHAFFVVRLGWGGWHGQVLRVYVGSFWDEPLMYDDNAALFDMEERDLMNDLRELPRNSAVRKINELVKRCRLAKVTVVTYRFASLFLSLSPFFGCIHRLGIYYVK